MAKIGVVTVLYNSEKVLQDFFESLDQQSFKDFKVYVVDNASPDNSLTEVKRLAESVEFDTEIIIEKENWGVAKGNNIGIKRALEEECEYILLSNNDVVLTVDSIQNLLKGLEKNKAAIAVPKIYFYDTGKIWYAGGYFSYYKGNNPHIGMNEIDDPKFNHSKITEYAPTCFMLIKSEVFNRVGLMDEKYFVYYDDSDFIWRAVKQKREKLMYIPYSQIYHKESSSTGGVLSNFSLYYSSRNNIYFCLKNLKFPQKQLTLLFIYLHTLLRKPFLLTKEQNKLIKQAHKDGKNLWCQQFIK